MDVDRLMELVAQYWDLAYAEGAEGRTHDTEDGAAQRVLSEIRAAVQALAVPEGWKLMPVEPTPEMVNTMSRSMFDETSSPHGIQYALWKQVYADLLAAVPQEPRDA